MNTDSTEKDKINFSNSLEDIGNNLYEIARFLHPDKEMTLIIPSYLGDTHLDVHTTYRIGSLFEPFDFRITLNDYLRFKSQET